MCCFSTLGSIGRTSRASLHCVSVCFFQQFWAAPLLQICQSWASLMGLVWWFKILSHLRRFFICGNLLSGVCTPACVISSLRDFGLGEWTHEPCVPTLCKCVFLVVLGCSALVDLLERVCFGACGCGRICWIWWFRIFFVTLQPNCKEN